MKIFRGALLPPWSLLEHLFDDGLIVSPSNEKPIEQDSIHLLLLLYLRDQFHH